MNGAGDAADIGAFEIPIFTFNITTVTCIELRYNAGTNEVEIFDPVGLTVLASKNAASLAAVVVNGTDLTDDKLQINFTGFPTSIPIFFNGAYYLGTSTGLLVSQDQGATWQKQGSEVSIWQGPFFGRDERSMLVVGEEHVLVTNDGGTHWKRVAAVKPKADDFLFTANWFGCYAWDPVNQILYASSMVNPVFKLNLSDK